MSPNVSIFAECGHLTACPAAAEGEETADSEGRGAGAAGEEGHVAMVVAITRIAKLFTITSLDKSFIITSFEKHLQSPVKKNVYNQ